MIEVFAPHLNRNVKLGACKLPTPEQVAQLPRLSKYRLAAVPASPASCAYNGPAMAVITDPEGNTSYGDCVLAEEAHYVAVETGNAGKLFVYTTTMTLAAYTALTGFNPADPSTDQGTDPIACLDYFLKNSYADGSVNRGYLLVDATNQAEVEYAISTFGNLKVWVAVPTAWISPFPAKHGFVWDVADPNPSNGHCIGSCGYITSGGAPQSLQVLGVTAAGVVVMTWGLLGTITWAAFAKLCAPSAGGGCAVRVTADWLNAAGKSPNGLDMATLIADFDAIGGTLPVPAPTPAPAPIPTGKATFEQAVAAMTAGINAGDPLQTQEQAIANGTSGMAAGWPAQS